VAAVRLRVAVGLVVAWLRVAVVIAWVHDIPAVAWLRIAVRLPGAVAP
jgi:hypothetical protein